MYRLLLACDLVPNPGPHCCTQVLQDCSWTSAACTGGSCLNGSCWSAPYPVRPGRVCFVLLNTDNRAGQGRLHLYILSRCLVAHAPTRTCRIVHVCGFRAPARCRATWVSIGSFIGVRVASLLHHHHVCLGDVPSLGWEELPVPGCCLTVHWPAGWTSGSTSLLWHWRAFTTTLQCPVSDGQPGTVAHDHATVLPCPDVHAGLLM